MQKPLMLEYCNSFSLVVLMRTIVNSLSLDFQLASVAANLPVTPSCRVKCIRQGTSSCRTCTPNSNSLLEIDVMLSTCCSSMHSCAIYMSTGVAAIAAQVAACAARFPRVAVVDTFTDAAYARSSVKLVGKSGPLLCAAQAAAVLALSSIDLSQQPHPAPHPRCGAVDMVSFMPLSDRKTTELQGSMKECDELAWELGRSLGAAGCPVLMYVFLLLHCSIFNDSPRYGARSSRTILETRRCTTFFSSTDAAAPRHVASSERPDFGPNDIPPNFGVAIVGSQAYVTNFNIQIASASLDDCKQVASKLRADLKIQCMALHHGCNMIEIGCNLQATDVMGCPSTDLVLNSVRRLLPATAIVSRAYIVGLTPSEALQAADSGIHS